MATASLTSRTPTTGPAWAPARCRSGSASATVRSPRPTDTPSGPAPTGSRPATSTATGSSIWSSRTASAATSAFCSARAAATDVSVLLGLGDGTFAPQIRYPVGAGNPFGLAVADFDGDGRVDLAVSIESTNAIAIL